MQVVLDITPEEADALFEAVDGVHQECLGAADNDEDPPVDDPEVVASLVDKVLRALRKARA